MSFKRLPVVLLMSMAALACGGSGLQQPDSATGRANDTAPMIDAGRADAPVCESADKPICLADCTQENPTTNEATCRAGQWICPSGFQDSKTCPADACAVTDYGCCDRITGEETPNPCPWQGGLRPSCPEGTKRGSYWMCIPDEFDIVQCEQLNKKACSGLAQSCGSSWGARVKCWCRQHTDAGTGIWECQPYLP